MGYPREVIEQVKKAVCKEAMEMRQLNHVVPVTGKRLQIVRPDRQIEVVFYPAKTEHAHTGIPRRWIPVWRLCPK